MSGDSPASVLYSSDGIELNVQNNTVTPVNTRGLLAAGYDGSTTRFILVDGYSRQIVAGAGTAGAPVGGVITIQGILGGIEVPVSGTLTANIGTTGGLALDSSINGILLSQGSTTSGQKGPLVQGAVTTAAPSYTTSQTSPLSLTTAGALRIDGSAVVQPISGTVTSNIGTTGGLALDATLAKLTIAQSTALGSNTQALIGGSVTTSSPTYTTGNINPFSLTTSGALRIDGSGSTQPISGTVTANIGTTNGLALDATLAKLTIAQSAALGSNTQALIGGSVTTAAPSYTTGNINPLSLTTSGALRVDGSGIVQPVSQNGTWTVQPGNTANTTPWLITINQGGNSATVTASNALKVDGSAVTQPVSGTVTANIGTTNGLALDTSVNGLLLSQGSTTSGQKGSLIQGAVTTAAPSYTTAQTSPLSLTTAGALRVDGSSATQPISGTITANIGTTGGIALDATLAKLTIAQSTALGSNTLALIGGSVTTAAPSYTTGNINPLSLTTTGSLRVDGSGVTQPVSGTIAATQSGTWTVQPGNTANTTPWLATISQGGNSANVTASNALKVDGSAVTQPVSGTITANIGTTNGLALDATLAKLTIAQSTSLGSNTQALIGGSVTTSSPTYTTGNINPLSLTTSGALRIDGSGAIQPVSQSGTWTVQPGNTANTTPWLTTISQGGNSATVTASNALKVDGSAVTQPVSGTITANIGTTNGLALDSSVNGILLSQGSTTSGQKGSLIQGAVTTSAPSYTTAQTSPLSLTTAGALRVDGSGTTQTINNTACSISRLLSAATTNATSVKGSAGNIFGWSIQNTNAAARYVKLYNKASAPTVGTDTPVITLLIPGGSAGAGNNLSTTNISFTTGIAFATTVNPADADTTAVAANDLIINLFYV